MAILVKNKIDESKVVESVTRSAAGAIATFSGVVRDHHKGKVVTGIDYHAYESMAIKELEKIEREAEESWPDTRAAIAHRIGMLQVSEASVFIAVSAPHRVDAFEACRFCIDRIKETVPVWKKEIYPDGYAWIEGS